MITISCGVMAIDLNCTIRWASFRIRNHINPKTYPTQSQTNTFTHMTEPHYEFVLAWLQLLDKNNNNNNNFKLKQQNQKKQKQRHPFHQLVHTSCAIAPLRQFDYLKLNRL